MTPGLRHLWVTLVINRKIKYLDLESTRLKEEDVVMACEAIKHPNCQLESLRYVPGVVLLFGFQGFVVLPSSSDVIIHRKLLKYYRELGIWVWLVVMVARRCVDKDCP